MGMRKICFLYLIAIFTLASFGVSFTETSWAAPRANVAGTYADTDNECEDDGHSITISQDGSSLTFNGGFDYNHVVDRESGRRIPQPYSGSIDGEGIITLTNSGSFSPQHVDCTATVSPDGVFSGTCNEFSVGREIPRACDFRYRLIVERTPPSSVGEVTTYADVDNNCEDDGDAITIIRNGSLLTFEGGFDYNHTRNPDTGAWISHPYTGTISDSGLIRFTNEGEGLRAECTATIAGEVFSGTCTVIHIGSGAVQENCNFVYRRVTDAPAETPREPAAEGAGGSTPPDKPKPAASSDTPSHRLERPPALEQGTGNRKAGGEKEKPAPPPSQTGGKPQITR